MNSDDRLPGEFNARESYGQVPFVLQTYYGTRTWPKQTSPPPPPPPTGALVRDQAAQRPEISVKRQLFKPEELELLALAAELDETDTEEGARNRTLGVAPVHEPPDRAI